MSTWLLSRAELTPEQIRAIELSPSEHRVILGPPGSGKTQILLHRARYLCDTWKTPAGRFHIFVFTNVLKEYIRSALDRLDLPLDCVSTLDSWCYTFYEERIGGKIPWDAANKCPDFPKIRRRVLEEVRRHPLRAPRYDFVMVDEGQDLDGTSFDLLRAIARHVTVCMDHKQRIYERGASEAEILKRLGLRKRNIALLQAFRCCPYVARTAAAFVDDPEEKRLYLQQVKTYQGEKETPVFYQASDLDDEKRRLGEVLRVRLAKGERVAVLFNQRRQVFGFANSLRQAGIEIETREDLDFSSSSPKFITYHSAKGLTFDTVLLPRLVGGSFPKKQEESIIRLLFVGITRATKWVYLSAVQGKELRCLSRLQPLVSEGVLTSQSGSALVLPPQDRPSPPEIPNDEDEIDVIDLL